MSLKIGTSVEGFWSLQFGPPSLLCPNYERQCRCSHCSDGNKDDFLFYFSIEFFDFDKDKDGLISFEEFKLMAKFFFKSANIDELQKDFNSIDLNGDGKLSLEGSLNYYNLWNNSDIDDDDL